MAFKLFKKSPKADKTAKPQPAASRPDDLSAAVNAWQGHGFATSTKRSAQSERDAKRGTVTYIDDLSSTSPSSSTVSTHMHPATGADRASVKTSTRSSAGSDALSQALHGYKGCALSA